jgi:hypothetical protein
MNKALVARQLMTELKLYSEARKTDSHQDCISYLGRAHILAQYKWFPHFYIHFLMFEYSWKRNDSLEWLAQLTRMLMTIPEHMFKKYPIGNVGWSSMGLFENKPMPNDLQKLMQV